MIEIHRHGVTYSDIATCPYCKCVIEFTKDEINTDGYVECPECHENFMAKNCHSDIPKYVRNSTKEVEAAQTCIEHIDFDELEKACHALATSMPDSFDYLAEHTSEELKQLALNEIARCFDYMEKYGYLVNYKSGGVAISYTTDGVFMVNTYYDPNEGNWWCDCAYSIASGGIY